MADVRSGTILPVLSDFSSFDGTPLYVNRTTARGYILDAVDAIVPLIANNTPWINVLDRGVMVDGVTDDTAALNALAPLVGRQSVIFPAGTCLVTDTVTWTEDRTNLLGAGQQATVIKFAPTTSGKDCFQFSNGGALAQAQCAVRGMAFDATGNTQAGKVAVHYIDNEELTLEDLAVSNWSDATKSCIGIRSQGRQTVRNIYQTLVADIPYSIEDNPGNTIDSDHYTFRDMYVIADATRPCFQVADGVNLTHMNFEGYQSWVQGKYGFYWNDTTTSLRGIGLAFNNIRWEQEAAGGAMFHISHNYGFDQVSFRNCYGGLNGDGYYLRKCAEISFVNVFYVGGTGATAMDIDATCSRVHLHPFVKNAAADPWTLTATEVEGTLYSGGNVYSYLPNAPGAGVVQSFNPSATNGFTQFEQPGFALLTGTAVKFCSASTKGLVLIVATAGAVTAIMAVNGSTHTTKLLVQSDGGWFGIAAAAANYNLYWDAGNGYYTIQNTMGYTETFAVTFLGSLGDH